MNLIRTEPLSVERLTVVVADLPSSLSGTKIVQLSDLHYDGWRLSEQLLTDAIVVSNRENPDLVLLTGDYVTDDPTPVNDLVMQLKNLESRCGTYACLGNHDLYYPNAKEIITAALTSVKIQVLWNAIATPLGQGLPIVGLADCWSSEFDPEPVLAAIDPTLPRLVLSHNPDTAAILQKWRVDLQLSGHTHGGQVVIPGLGSVPSLLQQWQSYAPQSIRSWLPGWRECSQIVKNWHWSQGWHQIGSNQLYINRGLGTYFPGRFGCPPELTVITLESQNS